MDPARHWNRTLVNAVLPPKPLNNLQASHVEVKEEAVSTAKTAHFSRCKYKNAPCFCHFHKCVGSKLLEYVTIARASVK